MLGGLQNAIGKVMVIGFDREEGAGHLLRLALRKYNPGPAAHRGVRIQEQLNALAPEIRESFLTALDNVVMSSIGANESPSLSILGWIEDLETGWAKIHVEEDGVNLHLRMWNGKEYVEGESIDVEEAARLIQRFLAEVGSSQDGPHATHRVVWAAVKANPFVDSDTIVKDLQNNTLEINGFDYEKAVELAKEQDFSKVDEEPSSEVWRSNVRNTTKDDICLIIPKNGGTVFVLPSSRVKGIKDGTTTKTCECWRCVARREYEERTGNKVNDPEAEDESSEE